MTFLQAIRVEVIFQQSFLLSALSRLTTTSAGGRLLLRLLLRLSPLVKFQLTAPCFLPAAVSWELQHHEASALLSTLVKFTSQKEAARVLKQPREAAHCIGIGYPIKSHQDLIFFPKAKLHTHFSRRFQEAKQCKAG